MEYKGYQYSLNAELKFAAPGVGTFETGAALKAAIDKLVRVKYEPIPIISIEGHSGAIKEFVATRPKTEDCSSVWVINGRSRMAIGYAYAATPENLAVAAAIKEHHAKAREHRKAADELIKTMARPVFKEI